MSQFETKPNKTGERTRQSFNKVEGDPFELFDFLFFGRAFMSPQLRGG